MEKCIRFPGFRYRALTLSYDDGVIYDERLIDTMSAHGIKGTFNLNSGNMPAPGVPSRRFSAEDVRRVYDNPCVEVATHGYNHLEPLHQDIPSFASEMLRDRLALEQLTGKIVRGMAYAYGGFNKELESVLKTVGITYSRTTRATHGFGIPADWLEWHPTCHHNDGELMNLCDRFLSSDGKNDWARMLSNPLIFYVWGHSYEFNDNNNWEIIEQFCEKMGGHDEIWYATNGEIRDYIEAARSLVWSMDSTIVYNPTCTDVYMHLDGKPVLIPAGQTLKL